jgi:hypothetical protein
MTNSYLFVSCDSGRVWKVFKSKAAVTSEFGQQIDPTSDFREPIRSATPESPTNPPGTQKTSILRLNERIGLLAPTEK